MNQQLKENVKNKSIWIRLLYMLLFTVLYTLAELVLAAVVIFQFFCNLFTARSNSELLSFGQNLAAYIYQIVQYLTFNSEQHPYPFGPWPGSTGNLSE